MKRKLILFIFLVIIFIISCLFIDKKSDNKNKELKTIKVAEVAHTIFYAPFYAAINNGYFEEEGINIDLILTSGADKVSAAVLSGDVDIGFCGSEATIYIYNNNEKDYLINFAKLTQKDGSFLVSRKKYEEFELKDLIGKDVIGGRKGGMPEMTFEWALSQNNIDPKKDLNIDTSIAFSAMQGAFVGGQGDFVTLFEPNATAVEKEGLGYVVGYIGSWGGIVPYTSFNAKKSYIDNNEETINGFINAINKGLEYVYNTDSKEVAKDVKEFFLDTKEEDLSIMIERYKQNEAWPKNSMIEEKEFNHIQDIIINANELDKKAPYDKLVYKGK